MTSKERVKKAIAHQQTDMKVSLKSKHRKHNELIGLDDCSGESGGPWELMEEFGLLPVEIVKPVKKVMRRK